MKRVVTGNYAAAFAAMRARVNVVAAFPITPQTFIVEHISEFVNDGIMDCEFIRVESEHSAMSATVSASATGARAFTATASQGLALMHEILFTASGMRLPIVMPVVNRTLAAPIGIWAEMNDVMPERDAGWILAFVEDNQEVHDMVLQAYRIAEDNRVLLPMMVNLDAFILSHTVEPVDLMEPEDADRFLPSYKPEHAYLDPERPMGVGIFTPPEYIQEERYQTHAAMEGSKQVIKEVNDEFAKMFGRDYGGLVEEYRMDDAEVALLTLGTVTSTAREVVDNLRAEGKKVGLVKVRFLRPYPTDEIRSVASRVKAIGIYDRAISYGVGGPAYIEARSALYGHTDIPISNYLAGIGGRDVMLSDIEFMFNDLLKNAESGKVRKELVWINTRGVEQ